MKVLLDIQNDKAVHILEILKSLPFVEIEELPDDKVQLIQEINEAVTNLKSVKEGKTKAKPIDELLDEL